MIRGIGRTIGIAAVLAVLLAGCVGSESSPRASSSAPSTSSTEDVAEDVAAGAAAAAATDGRLTVSLTQGRSDYARDAFAVAVENVSDGPIDVVSVTLRSPAFAADVVWDAGTSIPPGLTRALRVEVPTFACSAGERTVSAELLVELEGGRRSVGLVPTDPFEVIERLADAACLAADVERTVGLSLTDGLVVDGTGPTARATLGLVLTPTGGTGDEITVERVRATTLLSPATGEATWEVGVATDGTGDPLSIELDAIPARCDPHALAEDKVGTVLSVEVSTSDGLTGVVTVAASPTLRGELYAFVATTCGQDDGPPEDR